MHVVRGTGVDYYVRDLVPGRAEETAVNGQIFAVWITPESAPLAKT